MKKNKPGSWNVLLIMMAVAFLVTKTFARHISLPIMILSSFLTSKFREDIDKFGSGFRKSGRDLRNRLLRRERVEA